MLRQHLRLALELPKGLSDIPRVVLDRVPGGPDQLRAEPTGPDPPQSALLGVDDNRIDVARDLGKVVDERAQPRWGSSGSDSSQHSPSS